MLTPQQSDDLSAAFRRILRWEICAVGHNGEDLRHQLTHVSGGNSRAKNQQLTIALRNEELFAEFKQQHPLWGFQLLDGQHFILRKTLNGRAAVPTLKPLGVETIFAIAPGIT